MQLCIIDTGSANLNSVAQALRRLGETPVISSDLKDLEQADKLVLPGVGTASAVMGGVLKYGLRDFILHTHKPLLGICLGMQILGQSSEEVPLGSAEKLIPCLGLVSGKVKLFRCSEHLPHMGWNTVKHTGHPLFEGIRQEAYFYFDHSYALELGDYTIGESEYGERFTSALAAGTFMGVQFHPEKSGAVGARLLENFLHNF